MSNREVMQQALEALELSAVTVDSFGVQKATQAAITALKAALEQQAEPPPEWPLIKNILDEYGLQAIDFVAEWKAAQRRWQGLREEDWEHIDNKKGTSLDTFAQGAVWAADQLKEKNT